METPVQRVFACDQAGAMDDVAAAILALLPEPGTVALTGPLGAGKTTLVQALCRRLGVTDIAASPSFALMHEYHLPDGAPVYHFDFYRIRTDTELYDLGSEQYLFSGRWCFVEWADRAPHMLPPGCAAVDIAVEDGKRILTFSL